MITAKLVDKVIETLSQKRALDETEEMLNDRLMQSTKYMKFAVNTLRSSLPAQTVTILNFQMALDHMALSRVIALCNYMTILGYKLAQQEALEGALVDVDK